MVLADPHEILSSVGDVVAQLSEVEQRSPKRREHIEC